MQPIIINLISSRIFRGNFWFNFSFHSFYCLLFKFRDTEEYRGIRLLNNGKVKHYRRYSPPFALNRWLIIQQLIEQVCGRHRNMIATTMVIRGLPSLRRGWRIFGFECERGYNRSSSGKRWEEARRIERIELGMHDIEYRVTFIVCDDEHISDTTVAIDEGAIVRCSIRRDIHTHTGWA